MAEETFRHRAAANIPGAYEEDVFHGESETNNTQSSYINENHQVNIWAKKKIKEFFKHITRILGEAEELGPPPQRTWRIFTKIEIFQGLRFARAGSTVCGLQPHILPTEDLTGIYRFAVLLTGAPRAAQAALMDVFADAGEKIHHFRSGKSCEVWLVAKVRNRLLKSPAPATDKTTPENTESDSPLAVDLTPVALEFSERFSKIPEPGRSALALLYINHFSVQEIAQILQITLEELAEATGAARATLQQLEAAHQPAATPAEGQQS
jgi:DNA-directed RNA polymerase specialized sigma24 family protein